MIPIRDQLPIKTVPFVNYGLIFLTVASYLFQNLVVHSGYPEYVRDWGFIPLRFLANPLGDFLTIFTSIFLHGGLMHLGGNMLFLWIFGDNVEDALGHGRYLLFYLLGALFAACAQLLVDPSSVTPMIGASGAISAVLAAYVTMFPRAKVTVLVPIFFLVTFLEFPAWLVILEWFALQVFQGLGSLALPAASGVAFFAHIGGFVAGLLLVRLFVLGRSITSYDPWQGFARKSRPVHYVGYRRVPRGFYNN
jgi:membrane associated rhomboid family serine protease